MFPAPSGDPDARPERVDGSDLRVRGVRVTGARRASHSAQVNSV